MFILMRYPTEEKKMSRNINKILLIYDNACPLCDYYCRLIKIQESVGSLILINAREHSAERDEITALGLDIDQGMVLKMDSQIYYGADAIHALALIGSRSNIINRVNYWIFRSARGASIFYPVLRGCRNILLKLLRLKKINNLSVKGNKYF